MHIAEIGRLQVDNGIFARVIVGKKTLEMEFPFSEMEGGADFRRALIRKRQKFEQTQDLSHDEQAAFVAGCKDVLDMGRSEYPVAFGVAVN